MRARVRLPLLISAFVWLVTCSGAHDPDCRSPDELWPYATPARLTLESGVNELPQSKVCVQVHPSEVASAVIEAIHRAGIDAQESPLCGSALEVPISIEYQTMVSACIDCGGCLDGPRSGFAIIRLRTSGEDKQLASWRYMGGGTVRDIADKFARDLRAEFDSLPTGSPTPHRS
jgi:hypothetical protein